MYILRHQLGGPGMYPLLRTEGGLLQLPCVSVLKRSSINKTSEFHFPKVGAWMLRVLLGDPMWVACTPRSAGHNLQSPNSIHKCQLLNAESMHKKPENSINLCVGAFFLTFYYKNFKYVKGIHNRVISLHALITELQQLSTHNQSCFITYMSYYMKTPQDPMFVYFYILH